MILKNNTYNSNKKNLLLIFPITNNKLQMNLITLNIKQIYTKYKKEFNIISYNNINNITFNGKLKQINIKYKQYFDLIFIINFNLNNLNNKNLSINDMKTHLLFNKQTDINLIDYKLFKLINNINDIEKHQILFNANDLIANDVKLDFFTYDIDFKNNKQTDAINIYLYYKYGIHNISNVLYLYTNTFSELLTNLPLQNKKVPIEYKNMIDILDKHNIGTFTYINNII